MHQMCDRIRRSLCQSIAPIDSLSLTHTVNSSDDEEDDGNDKDDE